MGKKNKRGRGEEQAAGDGGQGDVRSRVKVDHRQGKRGRGGGDDGGDGGVP